MNKFFLRLAINAIALYLAVGTGLIPYIEPQSDQWWSYLIMGFIFAVVNAVLGPILKFLTCPLIILSLGLFTLVINTMLFYFTGWLGSLIGYGFTIESFWAGFLGALLVGVVNAVLTIIFRRELASP